MSELIITETSSRVRTRAYTGRGGYSMTWREYEAKPRLYVHPAGETVLDNLFVGRRNRPVDLYRALLPEMFKALGLPEGTKASWSQKAGCSCGCSPGFILTLPEFVNDWELRHSDFWATIASTDGRASVAAVGPDLADDAEAAGLYPTTERQLKEFAASFME